MGISVFNPTSGPSIKQVKMAQRGKSLEGSIVALIDNGKKNSDRVLLAIGEKLKQQFQVKEVFIHKKASFSHPVEEAEAEMLAKKCDFIISGIGD
nr:hypothetical protein [Bacillus pinisoli]